MTAVTPGRLLVRLPTWVGDTVMVTPALRALRRRFPGGSIVVQGRGHLERLLEGAGLFDEFLVLERGRGAARTNARRIQESRCDAAVIFPHSFRSAWEVRRGGVPRRYGYTREGRGWLLTDRLQPHRIRGSIVPIPMVRQYLELTGMLGATGDRRGPELTSTSRDDEEAQELYGAHGLEPRGFILLNAGASFGPSKIWPVEYLAELANRIEKSRGLRSVVFCGPGEEDLAADLAGRIEEGAVDTGKKILSLGASKTVLRDAALVVSTDTGPRHIAVAMGTPTLVLMGPTDPRYTSSHLGRSIVLRREVSCGPCHLKVCPIDHRCMRTISPEAALQSAEKLLSS